PTHKKTARSEHSINIIKLLFRLKEHGFSAAKISDFSSIPKSTVTRIFRTRKNKNGVILEPKKREKRPGKLN
ncbi:hypothetical protein P170DRAFT_390536, partial [Aspergillus steynii IBT 23096]